jgi:hypothetical protein
VAAGYKVVNGQIVKASACEGSFIKKFQCSNALVDATEQAKGLPVGGLVGWILVAIVLFLGIPLAAFLIRRRKGGSGLAMEAAGDAPDPGLSDGAGWP